MTDKPDGPGPGWTWPLRRRNAILAILVAAVSSGAYWFGIARRAPSKNARIHTEMTREQIETILGVPNRVGSLPGNRILCQYEGDGRTQLLVIFDHDCAIFVKVAEPQRSL
jgi:hypothetical protein